MDFALVRESGIERAIVHNLALHLAIAKAKPGDVLVVDYKGYMDSAVTGDVTNGAELTVLCGGDVSGVRTSDGGAVSAQ